MRTWFGSVMVLVACSACKAEGEPVPRAEDALDCVWVQDPELNCWLKMAAALDGCLGGDLADVGDLAEDFLSCTYTTTGRTITASKPLVTTTDPDAEVQPPPERDFTVKNGSGTECVRVHESGRVLTVSFAGSSLRWSVQQEQTELTCPDGKVYRGTQSALLSCLSPSGGVPGYAWSSEVTDAAERFSRSTFSLLGMKVPLYACRIPKKTPK